MNAQTTLPVTTNSKPQVSIGMPVYNGAKFIREALDSLLAQTFTDFELIISDNASTDETEAICREYAAKDKRIHYIRQRENLGATANFKYVLDEAVGEYFMWAAADDVWDKNWLAVLYPVARENNCLAFGTVRAIDEAGQMVHHPANNRLFSYTGIRLLRRIKYALEPNILGKANPIYSVFPKELIDEDAVNVLSSGVFAADTFLLYNALKQCQIKGTKAVCLHKRIHPGCAGGEACASDRITIFDKLRRFFMANIRCFCANLKNYGELSAPLERVVITAGLPLSMVYGIAIQVLNQLYRSPVVKPES
ncbi:MAG: glycosyltransferase [Pseudomonadota bacterium]